MREYARDTSKEMTAARVKEIRDELIEDLKKYNIRNVEQEVKDIMEVIHDGVYLKKVTGHFSLTINELLKEIEQEALLLCNHYLETDTDVKRGYCVKQNKDLIILNLILNSNSDGQQVHEELRKIIFDADTVAAK